MTPNCPPNRKIEHSLVMVKISVATHGLDEEVPMTVGDHAEMGKFEHHIHHPHDTT